MNTDKNINRKKYNFQGLNLEMKQRTLAVRKDTQLFLYNFLQYAKSFESDDNTSMYIAASTYFSDEEKLKELFSKTLNGDIDKISYDVDDDTKYLELITFAVNLFTDFFSPTLVSQKATSKKSKN